MSTEPEILASDRPGGTRRRLVVAGVAAAALAVGGAVTAAAASAPSPSPSPSASPTAPGSASGSAAPKAERQHQPHLAGTVVSASGNTITVTDRDGFQRTVHTTADTEYADGLTATPAAGTRVFAVGTVDSDKTSLLATRVATMPERGAAGEKRRGPHPGGPGRPDRPGDRPEPPDSSATPGPSGSASPTPSPSPTR